MIDNVEIRELKTHADERGFFRELIRSTDDFSMKVSVSGVTR